MLWRASGDGINMPVCPATTKRLCCETMNIIYQFLQLFFGGNHLSKNYKITAPSLNKALRIAMQEVHKEYVEYFHIDLENILSNCKHAETIAEIIEIL